MASYLPPTENLPVFDNTVFDSNNTSLTYTTAKKYFLTFPTAQGTQTITDFIAGSISYLTPSSGSFFNIGTNQVSGGTIRIGPTGASGVSVHAGNIDCTNNQINNATDSALNNLSLGNLQTSGVLNIGTGARVTSGNGGAINIGTTSTNSAPINIGGVNTSATVSTSASTSNVSLNGSKLWSNWTSDVSIRSGGTLTLTSGNSSNVNIATESYSDITIGVSGTSANSKTTTIATEQTRIGTGLSTSEIILGNGTNNTTGTKNGICNINKLQIGTTIAGAGIGTGTPFRCVIIERNVGSTTSSSGTITIPGAPTGSGNPIVFASINTVNPSYFITVAPASATTFTYQKSFWTGSSIGGATSETFNYIAYYL
jgi:hypothetical protein